MIRNLLILGVLVTASGVSRTGHTVHAGDPKLSKLERTAQHIFEQSDADKNATLSLAERALADQRSAKAVRQFVHDLTIGGRNVLPPVAEPQLADLQAMTNAEFVQHFESLAAKADADLRAQRIAKNQPLPASSQFSRPPVVSNFVKDWGRGYGYDDRDVGKQLGPNQNRFLMPHQMQNVPQQPAFNPGSQSAPAHNSQPTHEPAPKGDSKGGHGGHGGK